MAETATDDSVDRLLSQISTLMAGVELHAGLTALAVSINLICAQATKTPEAAEMLLARVQAYARNALTTDYATFKETSMLAQSHNQAGHS